MRIIFIIVFFFFLTSLTPQGFGLHKQDHQSEDYSYIEVNKSIDYDSIINQINNDTELIKKERERIAKNESKIKSLDRKNKVILKNIETKLKEQKQKYIVVNPICESCHDLDTLK